MRIMLGACPAWRSWRVGSLSGWRVKSPGGCRPCHYPGPRSRLGDTAVESEAVRLFLERAQEVKPGFAATEHNTAAIAHVCYRLDGLPLAVELGATRVNVLMPEQIADELDRRFRLLVGGCRAAVPRLQTLLAAFDWSFDLLTESERVVLWRLACFTGGFGLEEARSDCAGSNVSATEVLDVPTHLVNNLWSQQTSAHQSPAFTYSRLCRNMQPRNCNNQVKRVRRRLGTWGVSSGFYEPGECGRVVHRARNRRAARNWQHCATHPR
jgi:predicted ATPase